MSEPVEQQPSADVSPLHSNDFRAFLAHREKSGNSTAPAATPEAETAAEPETAEEPSAEAETEAQQETEETEATEQPKKPKQKDIDSRISSYAKRAKEAERLASEQRTRIEELERQISGKQEKPAAKTEAAESRPKRPERPKLADFDSYDKFHEATEKYLDEFADYTEKLSDYKLTQREAEAERKQLEAKQQESAKAVNKAWADREADGRAKYDDYDEVAHAADVPITPGMSAAIMESDIGPELAYYLGSNREEAERISKLPVASQIRELGKIEAKLSASEAPETRKAAVASRAPAPGKPVRGGTPARLDPDKIIASSTNFRDAYSAWDQKRKSRLVR